MSHPKVKQPRPPQQYVISIHGDYVIAQLIVIILINGKGD